MLLESVDGPVRYKFQDGRQVLFVPGQPVELPEEDANRVVERTQGKVRPCEKRQKSEVVTEPAAEHPRPIYFESADGQILGPVTPHLLAMVGKGSQRRFWIVTEYQGQIRWVRNDRLRAQKEEGRR